MIRRAITVAAVVVGMMLAAAHGRPGPALAGEPVDGTRLREPPRYGLYYDRYEPAFYTGFAPRTDDPRRIHVHIGRGNQVRVTSVLAEETLRDYTRDLFHRYDTYRAMIDDERLELTQNTGFERFAEIVEGEAVPRLVAEEIGLDARALRRRNLALLERLNPGRVFRIRMPVREVVRRWVAEVRPEDQRRLDDARRLELINLMLPTRLWVAEVERGVAADLDTLVRAVPAADLRGEPGALEALEPAFLRLLARVSGGIYPVEGDALAFVEFTAVYPVGSVNEYTTYKGRRIPLYPTPGRRALTTHQRTKTVDHIPSKVQYSYFPWIPYMHVGTRLHNSFHTLWWRMEPSKASFLPAAWRGIDRDSRSGEPYRYLWLLSRGPMSHGCTHLNAGHILELRQMLPSDTERLYEVDTFINRSYLYDVFDIDGDFTPEVMGVQYFIAYSLQNKRPHRLRAPNERRAFYDWLYGGELAYRDDGGGILRDVRDGRFVGRHASPGRSYAELALYEAAYQPELLQFYRLVDIPFARELRKVGVHHPFGDERVTTTASR